jgi:parallel beta-helix repeat protein
MNKFQKSINLFLTSIIVLIFFSAIIGSSVKGEESPINSYIAPGAPDGITLDQLIKIGVLNDLNEISGDHSWKGSLLAVKEINEAGGITIDGSQYYVGLIAEDTGEDQPFINFSKVFEATNEMINTHNPHFIIGGSRYEAVKEYFEFIMDASIPFIGTGSARDYYCEKVLSNYERYKYFFRCMPMNSSGISEMLVSYIEYLADEMSTILDKPVKNVALLCENILWASDMSNKIKSLLLESGLNLVSEITFPYYSSYEDFLTYWSQIDSIGAQIAIPIVGGPSKVPIDKAYKDVQPNCLIAGINIGAGYNGDHWLETEGGCEYEISMQTIYNVPITPLTQPFWNNFIANYSVEPYYTAIGSYNAIQLLTHAVQLSQSFNPDNIVSQLENINHLNPFTTVSGNLAFISSHDLLKGYDYSSSLFCQWQNGGNKVVLSSGELLYPDSITTGTLQLPEWGINDPSIRYVNGNQGWVDLRNEGKCTGSGTYEDPYIIKDEIIDCDYILSGIIIENSDVYFKIQNCTIDKSAYGLEPYVEGAIKLNNVRNGWITNNSFNDNMYMAICLYDCNNIYIYENELNVNSGIYLFNSNNTNIFNNSLNESGMRIEYSSNNNLNFNEFIDGGIGFLNSDDINIISNIFESDAPIWGGYSNRLIIENNSISNAYPNQVYPAFNCLSIFDSEIRNNSITNSQFGMAIIGNNNLITENYINNVYNFGIAVGSYGEHKSKDVNITDNFITNIAQGDYTLGFGIACNNVSNIKVCRNKINNTNYGIFFDIYCYNNYFFGNEIFESEYGIYLNRTFESTLIKNHLHNNNFAGIILNTSDYNLVLGNKLKYNSIYGISISSSSNENLIFNNTFIGNFMNALDDGNLNQWDNKSIGNYWDDYDGIDSNGDGIGDIPYYILGTAGSIDSYPIFFFNISTPVGEEIEIEDPISDVTIIFDEITTEGETIITVNETGPDPPSGFEVDETYYNISTTATFVKNITIAIPYNESNISESEENLRIMHWDGEWVDVTTWVDTENNIIYGEVTHLSLFIIIEPNLITDSYITDGDNNNITYFDLVFTENKQTGDFILVATNPGQFFYNLEILNEWPTTVDILSIELGIPEDFKLKGATPIHIYLDGIEVTEICLIDGISVTIFDVNPGCLIKLEIHLDYALKGSEFDNLNEFELKGYVFEAYISGMHGDQSIMGDYLYETDYIASSLISHQKKTTAIAGYVKDAYGNPIANADVELYDSLGNLIRTTTTDENGFYYFIDIPEDDYEVHVIVDSIREIKVATASKNDLTELDFVINYEQK